MSGMTGANEVIPGLFWDKGGAVYNVKHPDFGAVGNGSADDTAAIQAALNAAGASLAAGTGGVVYFPPGVYLCSFQGSFNFGALGLGTMDYSLTLPMISRNTLNTGLVLRGAGRNASILKKSTSGGSHLADFNLLLVPAVAGQGAMNYTLEDLTLNGAQTAANTPFTSGGQHLLMAPNTDYLRVHRCRFHNARGGGIYLWQSAFGSIADCDFEGLDWNDANNGITLIGGTAYLTGEIVGGHVVSNCRFWNCHQIGIGIGGYSGSGEQDDTSVRNCTFIADQTVVGSGLGIEVNVSATPSDLNRLVVSGCHFFGCRGMTLGGHDVTVEGCTFKNMNQTAGLGNAIAMTSGTPDRMDRIAIIGCHVDTTAGDAVILRGTCTVIGCTIDAAGGYGINLPSGAGQAVNAKIVDCTITNSSTGAINDQGAKTYRAGNRFKVDGTLQGRAVLSGGTVTVSTTEVLAADNIRLTPVVAGGTPGFVRVSTITAGTSFVITSSSGTDSSTVFWEVVH